MCKVSIVIPVYNSAHFLGSTLDSIFAQTYSNFECILVDDGSTDNSYDVVQQYQDARIKYIKQENSGGPAKPRNVGIANATGEYVFLFDADDVMHPTKIEKSVAALAGSPSADFLFTNFSSVDEKGSLLVNNYLQGYEALWRVLATLSPTNNAFLMASDVLYPALIYANFIGTSSVAVRRSALSSTDRFNESLKNSDDRLFWILFAKKHNGIFLNEILHQYRIQPNSITNQDFLRRGPSKIQALNIVYDDCQVLLLKKEIVVQLAMNCLGMAYTYKEKKLPLKQLEYSYKSALHKVSFRAIKLFMHAIFRLIFPYKK